MPERGRSGGQEAKRIRDGNRSGCRGTLGVNRDGRSAPLEGGVKQIDIGEDDDQQHDKYHAAKNHQTRRFYFPPRHVH